MNATFIKIAIRALVIFPLLFPLLLHAENIDPSNAVATNSSSAERRVPLNVAFLVNLKVDVEKESLEVAQHAIFAAVTMLRAEDTVSLIQFGNSAHRLLNSRPISNSQELLDAIRKLKGEEGANLFVALSKAGVELHSNFEEKEVHHIIVLQSNRSTYGAFSKAELKQLAASL